MPLIHMLAHVPRPRSVVLRPLPPSTDPFIPERQMDDVLSIVVPMAEESIPMRGYTTRDQLQVGDAAQNSVSPLPQTDEDADIYDVTPPRSPRQQAAQHTGGTSETRARQTSISSAVSALTSRAVTVPINSRE